MWWIPTSVNVCNAMLFACDSYSGYFKSLKLMNSQEFIDGIFEAQRGDNVQVNSEITCYL